MSAIAKETKINDWTLSVGTVFRFPKDYPDNPNCCTQSGLLSGTLNTVVSVFLNGNGNKHVLWRAIGCKSPCSPNKWETLHPPHCNGLGEKYLLESAIIIPDAPVYLFNDKDRIKLILDEMNGEKK